MGIEKAKVAIVDARDRILVPIRSWEEDTRRLKPDLFGGTHDPGETNPAHVVRRETGEELLGAELDNITLLYEHSSRKYGVPVVSRFFAATAEFPPEGVVLGPEHLGFAWVPREDFAELDIPDKYKTAVRLGAPIFEELVELQRSVHQQEYVKLAA